MQPKKRKRIKKDDLFYSVLAKVVSESDWRKRAKESEQRIVAKYGVRNLFKKML